MADFVAKSVTKSAERILTTPIDTMGSFVALVNDFIWRARSGVSPTPRWVDYCRRCPGIRVLLRKGRVRRRPGKNSRIYLGQGTDLPGSHH
jgi:hypothetical protein